MELSGGEGPDGHPGEVPLVVRLVRMEHGFSHPDMRPRSYVRCFCCGSAFDDRRSMEGLKVLRPTRVVAIFGVVYLAFAV